MTGHVLCIGNIADTITRPLQKQNIIHRITAAEAPSPKPSDDWANVRVAVTGATGAPAALIDALPALELIAVSGVGVDAIDLVRCAERGITVTSLSEGLKTGGATTAYDGSRSNVLADDVADAAMALLLAVNRNIVTNDALVRRGEWGKQPIAVGSRVSGRRLGIFGLGQIGRAVARRATGFDMAVGYVSRSPVAVSWRRFDTLIALADWANVLVICAPSTPQTTGAVDAAVLKALGRDGVLINVARGSIVDEDALVTALTDGTIRAAGLDVFRKEPYVPEVLRSLTNVVLTPHQGTTRETRTVMHELVVATVEAQLARPPRRKE